MGDASGSALTSGLREKATQGSAHRVSIVAIVLALCLVGLALPRMALAASQAVGSFTYSHSFASEGQLRINLGARGGTTLVEAGTGNVLVANEESVAVYGPGSSAADPPIAEFATGYDFAIAQSPTGGPIYVLDGFGNVSKWTSDGSAIPSYTEDASFHLGGPSGNLIAVDPSTGDLLVLNSAEEKMFRYSSSGQELSSSRVGEYGYEVGLVAAADGSSYTVGAGGLRHFSSTGVPLWLVPPHEEGRQEPTIDPSTGTVDVLSEDGSGHHKLVGYSSAGEQRFTVPMNFPGAGSGVVYGLAISPTDGNLYLVSRTEIAVFAPAVYPGVESPKVLSVGTHSVRLSAEVDEGEESPGAGPPAGSFARFESSSDGGQTWTPAANLTVGVGGKIEGEVTGLTPNTTYKFRAVAGNDALTHWGAATVVTTEGVGPIVTTGGTTEISTTGASVSGTIETIGSPTGYFFEYGLSGSYGARVPAAREAVAGSGRGPVPVSQEITGLSPGSTYHYRIVATNRFGRSMGEDKTFSTPVEGGEVARAYEQVTPVDKQGGILDTRDGFAASDDGSAVVFSSRPPGGSVRSNPWIARFAATRGPEGWVVRGTDPPLGLSVGYLEAATLANSSDMSHAFVATDQALSPGAVAGNLNLYVEDVETGGFQMVATSGQARALAAFTALGGPEREWVFGGTPNFNSVVFDSPVPLIEGETQGGVYRWSATTGLELVSVLSGGVIPADPVGSVEASKDGSYVYFGLQESGGLSPEGVYLRHDGETVPVSVSEVAGASTTPQYGYLEGASEDGRYAFFISPSRLTETAPESFGSQAFGLYRYDAETGRLLYIGEAYVGIGQAFTVPFISRDGRTIYFDHPSETLVWRDGRVTEAAPISVPHRSGFGSPDGRYFVYGAPEGIVLFDAESGERTCVSCGGEGSGVNQLPIALPVSAVAQVVDNEGEVFFGTTARLVRADTNGLSDVYGYKAGRGAFLVTPGTGPFAATLGGISDNANDVFFFTEQGLVGQDQDRTTDLYDARRGGGIPGQNTTAAPPCEGESCQGSSSSSPPSPANGSEALSGLSRQQKNKKSKAAKCTKRKARPPGGCATKHANRKHHKKKTTTTGHAGGSAGNR